ncbi:PorE family type IX secretion system protein [Roseimarinus sediminis]|uniref:PorE family type IX secretion system protein n=1 Tax=Roseimarinus sediminis TaxID=1610899 RepID=UPI003D1938FD
MQQHKYTFIYLIALILLLSACSSSRTANSALKSYEIGEYNAAIDKLIKAYRKEKLPDKRTEYDYYLANAYWYLDDYQRAELRIRNLLRKNYPDSSLVLKYAHALRYNGKFDDALASYQQFLDSFPNNQEALNGIEACKLIPVWEENPTRFEVNREKLLSSRYADFSPWFIGGLDNVIIFTSTRDGAAGKGKSEITGQNAADLFRSNFDIQRQRWEKPVPVDEELLINTPFEEGAASFSSDGNTMYFTRCEFDKKGSNGAAIYTALRSKDTWSDAVNIDLLPDSLVAAHPAISHDGMTLYFVSDMEGGQGGKDIWKVEKLANTWGPPENMGSEINTPGDELFPFIRDNDELYFSSDYHIGMGGLDLFKATYNESTKTWEVENMKVPINSAGDDFSITFIPGRDQGMFTSNRKGSTGDDLYSFILPPKIFRTEGLIVDSETESRINDAYIRVIGTDGTMLKVRSQDGKFQYRMAPETDYIFAAFKDGFLNAKQIISTTGLPDSKVFEIELKLTPTDAPVKVDNINYEFGKADLLPEAKKALDSLITILTINPTIVIEIMSHTDFVGSVQFNSNLSQQRAQGVVNYLIEQGINPKRLLAKGYGETWPKTVNRKLARQYEFLSRGDELTESFIMALTTEEEQEIAKAINRRTEFRVLSNDFREDYSAH